MMTKTVTHNIKLRCDLGFCDTAGHGPIVWACTTEQPELRLAELRAQGWLLGDVDACPGCAKAVRERRAEPMEAPDGA